MDDAFVRRHLTAVRALVLELVADSEPATPERIVEAWSARLPAVSARHRAALPRMAAETAWRLQNLEWLVRGQDGYRVTDLGHRVRKMAHTYH